MADLRRPYADLLVLQKRLRAIVHTSGLEVELNEDPGEPESLDDLALALAAVRSNLLLVENGLNDKDRKRNGPELRTRLQIKQDLAADRELLRGPMDVRSSRSREEVEANIRYDELQLARSYFPGCD